VRLGQIAFFPDGLKNRLDSQIEQRMEYSATQPDNEKQYSFHINLLAPDPRTFVFHRDLLADKNPAACTVACTSFLLWFGYRWRAPTRTRFRFSYDDFLAGSQEHVKKNH
jgi:hypothetical protein